MPFSDWTTDFDKKRILSQLVPHEIGFFHENRVFNSYNCNYKSSDWITYFGAFYFSLFPVKWWFFLQNEFLTLENVILRSDWSKLTRDLEK